MNEAPRGTSSSAITISGLATSFQVAREPASAPVNHAFCSAPSIVRPELSASGQGWATGSPHGWSER